MDHDDRIDSVRSAVRYLSERATTHGTTQVPNTPAWTVGEVATHVGWALWFWRHMMDATPKDQTARDRALAETPPFPPDLDPDRFAELVEPVLAHMSADEDAECYVSMTGGPGSLGLWARHALAEIGVHRMDVEAALGEPHAINPDESRDAVGYVTGCVLPAFRRMTGEDPGSLTIQLLDPAGDLVDTIEVASDGPGDAVVAGPAQQLLLALWGRPHTDVHVLEGDPAVWHTWNDLPRRSFQFAAQE